MKDYFKNLCNYENWANSDVVYAIVKADKVLPKALTLMSHIINAQTTWLSRIKNIKPPYSVWQDHDIGEISGILEKSSKELLDFIDNINEDDFTKVIRYENSKGEAFGNSVQDILTHMFIHSSYHRGQVIQLLKPEVNIVPYTDYIQFVRTVNKQ